jgi:pimeloyl-ACP methyl ester carboxylesterase
MIFVLAILLSSSGAVQTPSTAVPRFERGACVVEVAPDERIDCGMLVVPENRGRDDSRTIRLPVMIFRSRSENPSPDPIVFITGGPGNSSVAGRRSGKGISFLDERDFIVVEQRGARFAQPALECPEINRIKGEIAAGRLTRKDLIAPAEQCRQTLVTAGADLDGYTTAATADDLEDLRKLLGIAQWNLHGLSYGTRVALTVLRRHPAGVRSVVLDSVLPPQVNFDEVAAANLLRALSVVFDACAIDRECSAEAPNVRERFRELVARADSDPLPLGVGATVRGAQVVDAIYSALHMPKSIPQIPRIITSAHAGRYDALRELVKENLGPSRSTWGLRLSVWCGEEMPFENAARIASQISPSLGLGGIDEGTATPELCRAWNVKPAPAMENEPVTSGVPTLIFAGEFDPDTPPAWGRQLLQTMPNARYVEFRGRSHGAGFTACGTEIATAFFRSPSAPLPVDCALR